jgi:hypothetical protein
MRNHNCSNSIPPLGQKEQGSERRRDIFLEKQAKLGLADLAHQGAEGWRVDLPHEGK